LKSTERSEDVWDDQRESCVKEQLKHQGIAISMYWRLKYETKADTFWHKFYKRNQANFYKDRHYLDVEFPELSESKRQIELLEVGCGVGNAILPLLQDNPNLFVHAFDFAESAVNILRDEAVRCNLSHRISVSVCCVAKDKLPVEDESVDFVLCMFVLSAIAPQVLSNLNQLVSSA
jgi:ubiquinone/menaquinone biosynthesis C-methylase UbiE